MWKRSLPSHFHAQHRGRTYRASQRIQAPQEREHLGSWTRERIVNQEKMTTASLFIFIYLGGAHRVQQHDVGSQLPNQASTLGCSVESTES